MTHERQKKTSRARLTLDKTAFAKIGGGQFTLFDLVDSSFSFSHEKKQDAMRVLEALRSRPQPFKRLQEGLGLAKSSLFYLLLALESAGFVEKEEGKNKDYRLSPGFSQNLSVLAEWWRGWLRSGN